MIPYRLLYLVPDLIGPPSGIARYCGMVCEALSGAGVQMTVVALNDRKPATAQFSTRFPRAKYYVCNGSRPRFIWQALAEALRKRPQVVLVGHPNFAPTGWVVSRLTRARMATFIYGIEVWGPLRPARRWALQRSDIIISISRHTATKAQKANRIPIRKVRILHNCLDPAFRRDCKNRKSSRGLSLLTVARMSMAERYKGHDYVIRAMPALLSRFPGLSYNIVGGGDWQPQLQSLAEEEGVSHAVHFHGIVPEDQLRERYMDTSVFIMPSRCEGFGFVFLEAMAQGTPAIGGNLDASREVILDGKTGYLVDPTSVQAIVDSASRLLADRELRDRMGETAASYVEQRFSFERFQQQLAAYLAELL
ncbi:MAG TPA: glycosyltransferase family 4 protein [Chloroflexia bacterium]|nr:glycosyltransferase family 4 protein [Chloroflexia bacterium]